MSDDSEPRDDELERFLNAQRAMSQPQSALHRKAAGQRFQFTLGRALASMVPLALASLCIHYALRFPVIAVLAIAMATICLGWAAAIFCRNMELVLVIPVCVLIAFVLLFVGA